MAEFFAKAIANTVVTLLYIGLYVLFCWLADLPLGGNGFWYGFAAVVICSPLLSDDDFNF